MSVIDQHFEVRPLIDIDELVASVMGKVDVGGGVRRRLCADIARESLR